MFFRYTCFTMNVNVTRKAFASIPVHFISTCPAILAGIALALVHIYNVYTIFHRETYEISSKARTNSTLQ